MAKAIRFANDTYFDTSGVNSDLIYLGISSESWNWTTKNQWTSVPFDTLLSKVGNKLSQSLPYVVVGDNVSLVRIYGKLTYYQCPSNDYMFMSITINGVNKVKTIEQTNQWGNIELTATLSVSPGDKIGISVYKSNESSYHLQNFTGGFTSAPANYLLVEVVQ